VVGPVLDGHKFRPGERILDGRSSPWNTLALWSVRKLALTGFLCIADGLPDVPPSLNAADGLGMLEAMNMPEGSAPMGSDSWWSGEDYPSFGFSRQMTTQKQAVPAGEQRQNRLVVDIVIIIIHLQISATKWGGLGLQYRLPARIFFCTNRRGCAPHFVFGIIL